MADLFGLLIFASLVLLAVSFFSPKTSLFWDKKNEPTKKRAYKFYGIALLVSFILLSISLNLDKKSGDATYKNSAAKEKIESTTPSAPALTQKQLDDIENEKLKVAYKEREDLTTKASTLTAIYEENEVRADGLFKGRTIFVEGIVSDIKKDIMDNIYVILKGDQIFRNVQCFFDDKNTASQLQKGMKVTFQGKCGGLMMNVQMNKCILVENLSTLRKEK